MSRIKHEKKANIKFYKYILIIALAIMVGITIMNIYNTKTGTISSVIKEKYLAEKSTATATTGNVIIKYQDTEGKDISDSETISGTIGDEYTTTRKDISGYETDGSNPINRIGNYDSSDITVVYKYKKSGVDEVKTSTDGSNVTVQVVKNQPTETQDLKFSIITEDENNNKVSGAKYIVMASNNLVIKNAVAYSSKLVVGNLTINSEGTDKYTITELLPGEGYAGISSAIGVNIVKAYNATTKKYDITANLDTTKEAKIEVTNDEVIVTILNRTKKVEPKPATPEDNKIFDLQISKSIVNAKLNVDGIKTTKEKEANKLLKIDIPKSKVNKTHMEVTYAIEVKNIGQVPGYATEISDIIPEGMKLSESANWKEDNGIAVSNIFEKNLLNPGESEIVNITFNWDLTENNIGLKTNIAKITSYYNDLGLQDATPDNNAEEPLLVTVKTGHIVLLALDVLVLSIILGSTIFVFKKRK